MPRPSSPLRKLAARPPATTNENAAASTTVAEEQNGLYHRLVQKGNEWGEELKAKTGLTVGELEPVLKSAVSWVGNLLPLIAGATIRIVVGLIITVIALYYFFADGPAMINGLMSISPMDKRHELELLARFAEISRSVVVATMLSAIVQGVLAGAGFYFALPSGAPIFLLMALTMVFAIIPFVGAAGVWIPTCIIIFLFGAQVFIVGGEAVDGGDWKVAAVLAVYCAVVVSGIDNVIKPLVLHGQANLHPLLALLSILGGIQVLGPVGILIGPMLVSFLQALLAMFRRELERWEDPTQKSLKLSPNAQALAEHIEAVGRRRRRRVRDNPPRQKLPSPPHPRKKVAKALPTLATCLVDSRESRLEWAAARRAVNSAGHRILAGKDFAMNVASVALVVAALGVNFGWQPSAEDPQAYEVLMQVEPELVDVLADGRQVPIESHVPASVTPIRNIRVIVGTDELPRTPISTSHEAKSQSPRIVRGQEPAPLEHTARFQGDDGWGSPTAGSSNQFDQRGPTIGAEPIRTAQSNPWTLDGTQQSAADAGNSLRNSVNSGIQQMNQQGQQLLDGAQKAGSDFGQQLQSMSGFSSSSPTTPAATSAGRSSPPPPLSSAASNSAITPDSWTSIRPELAPPRLATPPMPNGMRVASNPSTTRASAGPSFPPPPSNNAPPLHSVLATPSTTSSAAEQDWSSVWGTGPAASASGDDGSVGLVPVPPRPRTTTPAAITANSSPAPPVDDRYHPPAPPNQTASQAADDWANFGRSPTSTFENSQQHSPPPASQPPMHAAAEREQPDPRISITQATIGTQPPDTQSTRQTTGAGAEEVPWKPLLAVSLALAGSVGANFFLGMSYADARRRYRSLVAKTTYAFQKEAGIAA